MVLLIPGCAEHPSPPFPGSEGTSGMALHGSELFISSPSKKPFPIPPAVFAREKTSGRVGAVGFYARPGLQLLTGLVMGDKGFAARRHRCQHPLCAL